MPGVKGQSGRRRQPTNLHILHGNPGKRDLTAILATQPEIDSSDKIPEPTKRVRKDKAARTFWEENSHVLHKMQVLTDADIAMFESLCLAHALWSRALRGLRKFGMFTINKKGYAVKTQFVELESKYRSEYIKLMCEFGMSPASRSKISIPNKKKAKLDEWGEFVNQKQG